MFITLTKSAVDLLYILISISKAIRQADKLETYFEQNKECMHNTELTITRALLKQRLAMVYMVLSLNMDDNRIDNYQLVQMS